MSSEFIGFRVNRKKDADILQALENCKDRTKEIKRLLRIGIAVTQGAYISSTKPLMQEPEVKIKIESTEPPALVKTPKPKTQKKKQQKPMISEEDLVANILDGFE